MSLPKIFYDNRFSDAVPVASGTSAGDFDVLNLRDWRVYTFWKPDVLPATVRVNTGDVTKTADYLIVLNHDLNTQGATIEVRGSTDGFIGSDVLVATITPTDDSDFILEFAQATYRYWGIQITGTTVPTIAVVAVGNVLNMEKGLPNFDPLGRVPKVRNNRAKAGHPLGKVIEYENFNQMLSFRFSTEAWLRSTWVPAWVAHLRGNPFVFAWDIGTYPTEFWLVTVDGGFTATHEPGGISHLELTVQGVYP